MTPSGEHVLDNPMWSAVCSRHAHFNQNTSSSQHNDHVRYYPEDVSPFVACVAWDDTDLALLSTEILPEERTFSFIFHRPVDFPAEHFDLQLSLPLFQLVQDSPPPLSSQHEAVLGEGMSLRALTEKDDVQQMLFLTNLTKPGPFLPRTIAFGDYEGIFHGDKLVAMTGNRMQVPGYSEISAICTHPDYLGRGLASMLIQRACTRIHNEGYKPFLHVKMDNDRAIAVYEKMGFAIRARLQYMIFRKKKKSAVNHNHNDI